DLCEADNTGSNLSLRISSNGYLTGDMLLRLPSMRSVYLDPYTGMLSIDQIPGLTEPWQTLLSDGSNIPHDLFIPTLLELYRDNKGQTVTLNAPQQMGEEPYSRMKMVWLHWAGASGEKAKINLFQLIKSERKTTVDKTIEDMAGKTQKEKAEMKKICQLCYDHNYICSINNIERAMQSLAASESQDNRRKKKKPTKRKKYFYLVDTQFFVALHKNKRVGANIVLDVTADGIHEFVLGLFSTEGEKLDEIFKKNDIIHHEKQMCVVGSAVYAVGKALDSIFCKCSGSSDPVEKWPFLDYDAPEKEINSIQIMADELLLIYSKMGVSFMNPQNLELIPIQIGQKGSLTLTEDSKIILGNFERFSILGTKTWQEEDKKITHVGLGLNHHLIVMEMTSYPISFECSETMCGLPICQNTLKLIFTIPMPGVPMEICFINRSVGFFVSFTQHLNCTSYYQEMILQIDYYGKLRGVLPCLGPGPRSFFKCYLHGDPDLQAINRDQGQAGIYVYLRDGHDGIMAIRPAM
ncbi:hypothetical protein ACJMK2_033205, partial [Sinanodonta woodiana]